MQFIKEKSKLPQISPNNKQFYLYFAMPILLGILLVDGLGMDISQMAAKQIGLLRFIQSAGIDISTKSMIIMLQLIFALFYWHSIVKHRKSPDSHSITTKTVTNIVILIVLLLVMFLVAYTVIIIGFHEDSLASPSLPIRFLLICSQWDISFAIYAGLLVLFMVFTLYFPFILIYGLLRHLTR
jgi:hypothetical protein